MFPAAQAAMVQSATMAAPVRYLDHLMVPLVGPKSGRVLGSLLCGPPPAGGGGGAEGAEGAEGGRGGRVQNSPALMDAATAIAGAMEAVGDAEEKAARQVGESAPSEGQSAPSEGQSAPP